MGINIAKLENVKRKGSDIIARCPACAETGNDHSGDHLIIYESGQFSCVVNDGDDGHAHRQRIFELVGDGIATCPCFEIRKPLYASSAGPKVIQKDVLGHLGHFYSTHTRIGEEVSINTNSNDIEKDININVPTVPLSINVETDKLTDANIACVRKHRTKQRQISEIGIRK